MRAYGIEGGKMRVIANRPYARVLKLRCWFCSKELTIPYDLPAGGAGGGFHDPKAWRFSGWELCPFCQHAKVPRLRSRLRGGAVPPVSR